jgi:hypothetical protein
MHAHSHKHIFRHQHRLQKEKEVVRFMSSAQYLGLHLGWLFCKAIRVFFSAFIFAAFKATSLLFCARFFDFQLSRCIASASRLSRAVLVYVVRETQKNVRILQIFNGREPYDHVVQNIIIGFFRSRVEEAGYYYIHVRMPVMDSRGILGYLRVVCGMRWKAWRWIGLLD